MLRRTSKTSVRLGAVKASTVFAVTVAVIAGLIGAFLFKKFVLDKPAVAKADTVVAQEPMRELTVAAVNITICPIQPSHIKKIKITQKEFDQIMKRFNNADGHRGLLVGDQPLYRVPKGPGLRAEEPIFEDQLEPLEMPKYIRERLHPGKRAAMVYVPNTQAMIQVGDYVDITGTLMHDAFGPNGATTACLASGRVIARFGTIKPECCPTNPGAPLREFTVEVTPCEYGLLELARNLGATFSLSVGATRPEEEPVTAASTDGKDDGCCTATMADLEKAFRIPPRPEKKEVPNPNVIEIYNGVKPVAGRAWYPPDADVTPRTQGTKAPESKPVRKNPVTPISGSK